MPRIKLRVQELRSNAALLASLQSVEANRIADSNYRLAQEVLNNQMIAFKAEHTTFIKVDNFRWSDFKENKNPTIDFDIIDLGSVPIKINRLKTQLFYKSTVGHNPSGYLNTIKYSPIPNVTYISMQTPEHRTFTDTITLTKEIINKVNSYKLTMFCCGEIEYYNQFTNSTIKCAFNVFIFPNRKEYRIVYINNEIVKPINKGQD